MKKFFVDLWEMVWLNEIEWFKLHWKGYTVFLAVTGAICAGAAFITTKLESERLYEAISKRDIEETEAE